MEKLGAGDPQRIGAYRLLARLGAGGMGRVYLARSDRGRTVAVKLVREDLAAQEEFRARFRQEVRAARQVGGHWTAPVLDADTEAAVPWVATGYVAGPSLQQVVGHDHGPLAERSVRILAAGLAHALGDIHAAGIVHRDLKPSNVLVTIDGPRVIDFGIARALETLAGDGLTRTGSLVGSPGFMAPEQVRGDRITPACDVFCLGSVLAYAATGRQPFGTASTGAHAQMFRIVQEEPDLTDVPEALADLVRDCLRKDPAARPTLDRILERTGASDTVHGGRSRDPWLPAALVAQLARHAVRLLDTEDPEARVAPGGTGPDAAPDPTPVDPSAPDGGYAPVSPGGAAPAVDAVPSAGAAGGGGSGLPAGAVRGESPGKGAAAGAGPRGEVVIGIEVVAGAGAVPGPAVRDGEAAAGPGTDGSGTAGSGAGARVKASAAAGPGATGSGAEGPAGAGDRVADRTGNEPTLVRQPTGDRDPAPGQSTGDRNPAPGQPTGDRNPTPGQRTGDRNPTPGQPAEDGPGREGAGSGRLFEKPAGRRGPAETPAGQTPETPAGQTPAQQAPSGHTSASPEHAPADASTPPPGDPRLPAAGDRLPTVVVGAETPPPGAPPAHPGPGHPQAPADPGAQAHPQQAQPPGHGSPRQAPAPGHGYPQQPAAGARTGYAQPSGPGPYPGGPGATPPYGPGPAAGVPPYEQEGTPSYGLGGTPPYGAGGVPVREPERGNGRSTALLVVIALVVAVATAGSVYALLGGGGNDDDKGGATVTTAPTAETDTSAPLTASDPTPSGSAALETPGDGTIPAGYLGTWDASIDNATGRNTRQLTIAQGEVGDTVLTLVADGPAAGGGSYHCVFTAALARQPVEGAPLEIGPSTVASGEPRSSCSPGEATEVTLLSDGRLRREKQGSGESLTYTRR